MVEIISPTLYTFYFGDSAERAERGASKRFQRWAKAFEGWYSEREGMFQKDAMKQTRLAFRRLAQNCKKMPWEVEAKDIEAHIEWMKEEGLAARTINCSIGIIASFYQWCAEHGTDRMCGEGFNPAREAQRIRIRRYEGAILWRAEEVKALLELVGRDTTALGKREYAFLVTRLSVGVSLKRVLELRWGQVKLEEGKAWVRWRLEGKAVRLADEAWRAMEECLRASGRLEGMKEASYIFAPLAEPGKEVRGGKAEEWVEGRAMHAATVLTSLKIYGRKLGIEDEKLTMMALRRTAIRMKMGIGENTGEMQEFMDSRSETRGTKHRMKRLKGIEVGEAGVGVEAGKLAELPDRQAKPFKRGENIIHGLYSKQDRREAVQQVMAEGITGMEVETQCLRQLMQGLHERDTFSSEAVEVYSKAARRLGELLAVETTRQPDPREAWAEEVLKMADRVQAERGLPPVSEQARQEALYGDWEDGEGISMAEEIATVRLMLRGLYERGESGVGDREYLHLVDLYGEVCTRLARLIKLSGGSQSGRLPRYIDKQIEQAIDEVMEELGIG